MTQKNISQPKNDEALTHEFSISLHDLCELPEGIASLNEVLDESMEESGITHYATDINYEAISIDEDGFIVIRATYIPEENE